MNNVFYRDVKPYSMINYWSYQYGLIILEKGWSNTVCIQNILMRLNYVI